MTRIKTFILATKSLQSRAKNHENASKSQRMANFDVQNLGRAMIMKN